MRLLLLCLLLTLTHASFAANTVTYSNGRIEAIELDGKPVPVTTDIRFALRGVAKQPGLDDATDVAITREGTTSASQGTVELAPGKKYRFEQVLTQSGDDIKLSTKVTAEADIETEGVYLWLDVPVESFGGGYGEFYRGPDRAEEGCATLTKYMPVTTHHQTAERQWTLLRGNTADRIVLTDAQEQTRIEAKLGRSVIVTLTDTRQTGGNTYSCRIPIAPKLKAGESASFDVTLRLTKLPGRGVANLSMDSSNVRYELDGFGGDYCFNPGTPVTQYTLDNLNSAWARTEMSLEQWVLEEGKVTAEKIDWDYLKAQDKPNSNLRREFLMAQKLQQKGVPYVISVWDIPTWLYEDPKQPSYVAKDKWPELAALVGSYLLYAKQNYGVEPDLFSFNEPNSGVRVKLSPEHHRDQIKLLGAHFQSLGLKTKMLLADVINVGHHSYVSPTADDPKAMQYVGAVAFHSWGRPNLPAYEKWGEVAKQLKLPLLVTEAGADVNAWRDKSYSTSYHYALSELRQYQDLLLHSRPQGFMYWEFTADYSLVRTIKDAEGNATIEPTQRFWFMKHFCNLTPHKSGVLATKSDVPNILFTAFSSQADTKKLYTLHIANLSGGTPRRAKITGIPAGVTSLRAIRSGEKDAFKELPSVSVINGTVELELQPESLLTLTNMPR